jgi:FkbM family methyltransferase
MNISIGEIVIGHIRYWINFLKMLLTLNKTFENSLTLLFKILKNKFPIDVTLKNKTQLSLESFSAVFLIAYSQKIPSVKYDVEKDMVVISSSKLLDKEIKFHGGVNNGDIIYGFVANDYGKLPVRGKTVIDIGANIGDTPIYFALHGASKVIGVEPFPKNYELAVENTALNGFSDKIKIILAGCSSKIGEIIIDPDYESNIESQLKNSSKGKVIPLLTIEEIIKRYDVPNGSILKIDCEGCEYDSILHTPDIALQRFSHIQIEYHLGYRDLKEKLEKCGFKTTISAPMATDVINTFFQFFQRKNHSKTTKENNDKNKSESIAKRSHEIRYCGFIYGVRQDKVRN